MSYISAQLQASGIVPRDKGRKRTAPPQDADIVDLTLEDEIADDLAEQRAKDLEVSIRHTTTHKTWFTCSPERTLDSRCENDQSSRGKHATPRISRNLLVPSPPILHQELSALQQKQGLRATKRVKMEVKMEVKAEVKAEDLSNGFGTRDIIDLA